jgi:hypothetical protein
MWKKLECSSTGQIVVLGRDIGHNRDYMAPLSPVKFKPTRKMRNYMVAQTVKGVEPKPLWYAIQTDQEFKGSAFGLPTYEQVRNFIKNYQKRYGTSNLLSTTEELVKEQCIWRDIEDHKPFIFGPFKGMNGCPRVGKGDDSDPLILGYTTKYLLRKGAHFGRINNFALLHIDATFKLSKLGYPVITCGYSDALRSYHLLCVVVVSRRTSYEYRSTLEALQHVTLQVVRTPLVVSAIMGDAEKAQLNAITEEFPDAMPLMCYFHVLYNVDKKTKAFSRIQRKTVYEWIYKMHFARDDADLSRIKEQALRSWRKEKLYDFLIYFESTWLESDYSRWQAYHSPIGYATTNNPCETYNRTMKRTISKRYDLRPLMERMAILVESESLRNPSINIFPHEMTSITMPTSLNSVTISKPTPTRHLKKLYNDHYADKFVIQPTSNPSQFYVKVKDDDTTIDNDYSSADDSPKEQSSEAIQLSSNANVNYDKGSGEEDEGSNESSNQGSSDSSEEESDNEHCPLQEMDSDELMWKSRAKKIFKSKQKWSDKLASTMEMPEQGFIVNPNNPNCQCKYFSKFGYCVHFIAARRAINQPLPGESRKAPSHHNRLRERKIKKKKAKKKKKSKKHQANSNKSTKNSKAKPRKTRQIRCLIRDYEIEE